ncbi:MAG TPA: MBL fold metallo-hydrolase [Phenylobacterium sp.]|uniref:MBL fold metallo-hydrolase n=1 Tax=Phenylobacterium sp. TaxID=1871053 RepID=UPI002C1AD948|nr:MBL fold metallo-hydrolase [Phenylobacterium sp.]HSV01955.1 MBL fold metallo-hydrolase [Phenylobacterium sp.]
MNKQVSITPDGVEDPHEAESRRRLVYPIELGPKVGEGVDVAPGVKWIRMPLGGSLAFINVWAIAEDGGWAIVDTGLNSEASMQAWRRAFAGVLEGKPVTRVFITHMHPDHIGMAGWLTRKFNVRLWISRLEFLMCRSLAADTGREAPPDALAFYRAAGWDQEALDTYRSRFGGFGRALHALPDSFQRMRDGEAIEIGGRTWRVVVGSGHTPEHVCLWCPELKLMISGDQVLPKITSNVSVFPTEPAADPLDDWLTSLARIKTIVPDDVLVLPAHNEPFHGLHARIDALIGGHERRLAHLKVEIAEPKRAVDVFHVLFRRKIDGNNIGMATGESLAHLNCLMARGQAVRRRDERGVDWYQAE